MREHESVHVPAFFQSGFRRSEYSCTHFRMAKPRSEHLQYGLTSKLIKHEQLMLMWYAFVIHFCSTCVGPHTVWAFGIKTHILPYTFAA